MRAALARCGAALLPVLLVAAPAAAQDPEAFAAAHWIGCASCHGDDGEGVRARHAPAIAGLDAGYVERQLRAFRSGIRGADARDIPGKQMSLIAATLGDDAVLGALARRVAALPSTTAPRTLAGGDAERGSRAYAACAACHGARAEGGATAGAPRLSGRDDWYLLAQLRNFRAGARGYADEDLYGRQMAAAAATLTGEAQLLDLIAYLATLAPAPG